MVLWESTNGNPAIHASQCASIAGISSGGALTHAWTNEVSLVADFNHADDNLRSDEHWNWLGPITFG